MSLWNDPELTQLFNAQTPLIDVRAPIEFLENKIPNSINLPLMINKERHEVGICYKQLGQEAAINLGHKLVSGKIKEERISAWIHFLNKHPDARVFCARGGLRSQISCQWISDHGIKQTPLLGGHKKIRQFFLSRLNEAPIPKIVRLGGLTGSGKTPFLQTLPHHLDLEKIANHRGSAFGSLGLQPTQASFENDLALGIFQNPHKIIIEDESYSIGNCVIPSRFFGHMKMAPLILLETPMEQRIHNIYEDYVKNGKLDFFIKGVENLNKRLGGLRTQKLLSAIKIAFNEGQELKFHAGWIELLLNDYYDPIYKKQLKAQEDLILFKGNKLEVKNFILNLFT